MHLDSSEPTLGGFHAGQAPQVWPSLESALPPAPPAPAQPPSLSGSGQPLHCLAWPGLGHSTSVCLSFPPLSPLRPERVGGMTGGHSLLLPGGILRPGDTPCYQGRGNLFHSTL